MEIQVRHQPSFAVARIGFGPNEQIRAESGAMMAMSDGIEIQAKMEGGFLKSLKRAAMGGESFFITTFTAGPGGGWVDCASHLPGDIVVRTIHSDRALHIQRGSFLCAEGGVNIETKWAGFKNVFGDEGGFIIRAMGEGEIVLSCYGALDCTTLGPGERFVVDSGHMVCYDEGVTMNIRKAAGGIIQSLKSGEGIVMEFTGPGDVWTQSRNPGALETWIRSLIPSRE